MQKGQSRRGSSKAKKRKLIHRPLGSRASRKSWQDAKLASQVKCLDGCATVKPHGDKSIHGRRHLLSLLVFARQAAERRRAMSTSSIRPTMLRGSIGWRRLFFSWLLVFASVWRLCTDWLPLRLHDGRSSRAGGRPGGARRTSPGLLAGRDSSRAERINNFCALCA